MNRNSLFEEYKKISKPAYKQWWFYLICALSIVCVVFVAKVFTLAQDFEREPLDNEISYSDSSDSVFYSSESSSETENSASSSEEEVSDTGDSSTSEQSSSEDVSDIETPPKTSQSVDVVIKPPPKNPAPENITSERSSEDVSEESGGEIGNSDNSETSSEQTGNAVPGNPFCTTDCGERYIANINTKKFHHRRCSSVKQMKPINKGYCDSREFIISCGYVPCKRCNP